MPETRRQPKIFVIDDDFSVAPVVDALRDSGFDVHRLSGAAAAMEAIDDIAASDAVITDLMMERCDGLDEAATHGGHWTGIELAQTPARAPELPILILSGTQDSKAFQWCSKQPRMTYVSKLSAPELSEIVRKMMEMTNSRDMQKQLRPFIVHGHDSTALLELKNYLQNTIKTDEPIILRERSSGGRTIIEKFEDEAAFCDVAFVLLTPDDVGSAADDSNNQKRRGRQNVIFEMGFFLAKLGRRKGRVILLHKGELELPNDIAGLIYISIDHGVEAAGESIRRELATL